MANGKGEGGELKISYADLLLPSQRQALDFIIENAGKMMEGFTIGQGYPGLAGGSKAMYNPRTFGKWIGFDPHGNERIDLNPDQESPDPNRIRKDQLRGPRMDAQSQMEQFLSNPYMMAGGFGQFTDPFSNPFYAAMTGNQRRG